MVGRLLAKVMVYTSWFDTTKYQNRYLPDTMIRIGDDKGYFPWLCFFAILVLFSSFLSLSLAFLLQASATSGEVGGLWGPLSPSIGTS